MEMAICQAVRAVLWKKVKNKEIKAPGSKGRLPTGSPFCRRAPVIVRVLWDHSHSIFPPSQAV